MKKMLIGLFLGIIISLSTAVNAEQGLNVSLFHAGIKYDGKDVLAGDNVDILNYNGSAYLPARFVAEIFNKGVYFNESTYTIEFISNHVLGPSVDSTLAKLTAYEEFSIKSVSSIEIRPLTPAEWEKVPSEAKKYTPVYYVLKVITLDGEEKTVYISSNNKNHHFIL